MITAFREAVVAGLCELALPAHPPILTRVSGAAIPQVTPPRVLHAASARAPDAHKAEADPYAWLQERDTAEVLDYLKAENAYQEAQPPTRPPCAKPCSRRSRAASSKPTCRCPPLGPLPVLHAHHRRRRIRPPLPLPAPGRRQPALDESREELLLDPNPWPMAAFSPSARSASAPTTSAWPTASTPRRRDLHPVRQGIGHGASANCPSTTATAA
jgi:oligopeptidase B